MGFGAGRPWCSIHMGAWNSAGSAGRPGRRSSGRSQQTRRGDLNVDEPLVMKPHGDCTAAEADCLKLPTGEQARLGVSEAPDPVLDLVTFYSQNLGVHAAARCGRSASLARQVGVLWGGMRLVPCAEIRDVAGGG